MVIRFAEKNEMSTSEAAIHMMRYFFNSLSPDEKRLYQKNSN
jgi:hypothetical protein